MSLFRHQRIFFRKFSVPLQRDSSEHDIFVAQLSATNFHLEQEINEQFYYPRSVRLTA